MKIAFYAPMKPPDHPVPSGDRQMARLLICALEAAGHEIELASKLRTYFPEPSDDALATAKQAARREIDHMLAHWKTTQSPEAWICYHPYYKAPDLIGPQIASELSIPYVTIEASWSSKRATGPWAKLQALAQSAIEKAALNICFTDRDAQGLQRIVDPGTTGILLPFIDAAGYPNPKQHSTTDRLRLISVAMFRKGDKFESFKLLAQVLVNLRNVPWQLTIVGDGPLRNEVRNLFGTCPADSIIWRGEVPPDNVAPLLGQHDLYVWPGRGEAYGLAYLEAQAMGLPVIAMATAGVPAVVRHGETGILTPDSDIGALAEAIRYFHKHPEARKTMSAAARDFVRNERSLAAAAQTLQTLINRAAGTTRP